MANHCWNYVVFTGNNGDQKGLRQLLGSLKKTREDFIKSEKDVRENTVMIYGLNGHILLGTKPPEKNAEGNYTNDPYEEFGSKWFECEWEVQEADGVIGHINLQGDSAWSPMLPLFEKICKRMNLSCYGNYEESGMDFAGEFEYTEEGCINHTQMSYREYQAINNPNSYWEDLMLWIEEGVYETIEDVYAELKSVNWELTDTEKREIEQNFAEYLKSNEG